MSSIFYVLDKEDGIGLLWYIFYDLFKRSAIQILLFIVEFVCLDISFGVGSVNAVIDNLQYNSKPIPMEIVEMDEGILMALPSFVEIVHHLTLLLQ